MISINAVWEDSVAFVRREAHLLIPLALATLLVGDVVGSLAASGGRANSLFSLVVLVATLWTLIGQLAILSLALRPGSSVGEAIVHGARRLPVLLGTSLLIGLMAVIATLPIAAAVVASGVDPKTLSNSSRLPAVSAQIASSAPWAPLYMLVAGAAMIWLSLRLAVLNPLIVDRSAGVFTSLRTAFAMTRGFVAALLLVAFVYALTSVILGSAVQFVAGSLFLLIGRAIGSPFAGVVMAALASGLVSATLSCLAAVFLAMLYRRLSTGI